MAAIHNFCFSPASTPAAFEVIAVLPAADAVVRAAVCFKEADPVVCAAVVVFVCKAVCETVVSVCAEASVAVVSGLAVTAVVSAAAGA